MPVDLLVEKCEAIPLRIPMAGGDRESVLVVLRAGGLTGLGEAAVLPERGGDLARLHRELAGGTPVRTAGARAALECALLDLKARAAGVSVAALLGRVLRDRIACNALLSAVAPARVAAEVESWAEQGFSAFKLKAANLGGPLDMERLGAARWAAGGHAALRLDLNGRLSEQQASSALPSLALSRLELIEQPLPAKSPVAAWINLAAGSAVPLFADESLAEPDLSRGLAAAGFGLAIKLATVGGPRAALQLAGRAGAGLVFASSMETSVGIAAALHTACASPVPPLACGLATARRLEPDLGQGLVWDGSDLLLPSGPGLGVELDAAALRRYRLDR